MIKKSESTFKAWPYSFTYHLSNLIFPHNQTMPKAITDARDMKQIISFLLRCSASVTMRWMNEGKWRGKHLKDGEGVRAVSSPSTNSARKPLNKWTNRQGTVRRTGLLTAGATYPLPCSDAPHCCVVKSFQTDVLSRIQTKFRSLLSTHLTSPLQVLMAAVPLTPEASTVPMRWQEFPWKKRCSVVLSFLFSKTYSLEIRCSFAVRLNFKFRPL